MREVLILGAGIQGICSALAIADKDVRIRIIDKTSEPLQRSGLRNEGKVHLGFVYANDDSFRTASLMLHAALNFAPLIELFIKKKPDWNLLRSRRFNYLILNDTLLSEDKILNHYSRLQDSYNAMKDKGLHYIGKNPAELWKDDDLLIPYFNRSRVQRCIPTEEVALDLPAFREMLLNEMAAKGNIEFFGNHSIEEVKRTSNGFVVTGRNGAVDKWQLNSDIVVNCLWENRLYFDKQLGIDPGRKWVYRLKHRILGVAPKHIAALDSFTFVLGAFGDIVNYNNQMTYLSWYPECMSGWSSDLTIPDSWEDACNGRMEVAANRDWAMRALDNLNSIFPGFHEFDIRHIDGGVIFSWGKTDIVDMESELHQRYDIGVGEYDGYFSINTGKFTSAPLFASHLKELI